MTAVDIAAQATAWAVAEVEKQCLGEEYGVAVFAGAAMMPTPEGPRQIPVWTLLLTARNPLLKEGPLYHMVPVAPVRPAAEQVTAAVADGLRQLRDLAASKLAGLNGHAGKVPR